MTPTVIGLLECFVHRKYSESILKDELDDSYSRRTSRVLCTWQVLRAYIGRISSMTPTLIGFPECFAHGKYSEPILEG